MFHYFCLIGFLVFALVSAQLTLAASFFQTGPWEDVQEFAPHFMTYLKNVFQGNPNKYNLFDNEWFEGDQAECLACQEVVGLVQTLVSTNSSLEFLEDAAAEVCVVAKMYSKEVCVDTVAEMGPVVMDVLSNRFLKPLDVCEHFLMCNTTSSQAAQTKIASMKIPQEQLSAKIQEPFYGKMSSNKTGTFIHISDAHVDLLYAPNTNAYCGYPLCCREAFGSGDAGFWGMYNCDTPPHTLVNMLQFWNHSLTPLPDFVVYTGDNPPHDVWEQSRGENLNVSRFLFDSMQEQVPGLLVLPAVGNHEPFPVDEFTVDGQTVWLTDSLADYWAAWLPESALGTLRYGGYYTAKVTDKLRVVAINTQFCDINNFYLILNDTDPYEQLSWLQGILEAAAQADEKVLLLGHIPPAHSTCLYEYSSKLVNILAQFNDSQIVGQLFGHTHQDEFELLKDPVTNRTIGTFMIAPSVTTSIDINPGFRVFEYDTDTYQLLDYTQWHNNISSSFLTNETNWQVEYTFTDMYQLPDLSPASYDALVASFIADNSSSWTDFWNLHSSNSTDGQASCTGKCRKDELCAIQASTYKDALACNGLNYTLSNLWPYLMNSLC